VKQSTSFSSNTTNSTNNITLWSFDGLWNFTIGFINATNATNYNNIDECRDSIESQWIVNANLLANVTEEGDWLDAAYYLWDMTGATD